MGRDAPAIAKGNAVLKVLSRQEVNSELGHTLLQPSFGLLQTQAPTSSIPTAFPRAGRRGAYLELGPGPAGSAAAWFRSKGVSLQQSTEQTKRRVARIIKSSSQKPGQSCLVNMVATGCHAPDLGRCGLWHVEVFGKGKFK